MRIMGGGVKKMKIEMGWGEKKENEGGVLNKKEKERGGEERAEGDVMGREERKKTLLEKLGTNKSRKILVSIQKKRRKKGSPSFREVEGRKKI